jgi:2-keto-myo-inositol isomerase
MVAPSRSIIGLLELANSLGLGAIELRNDIGPHSITSRQQAAEAGRAAKTFGIEIISINALQRFNEWSDQRAREAEVLANMAKAAAARGLVLCPVNAADDKATPEEKRRQLRAALGALAPILRDRGLLGLVEPLGFTTCSLRSKREAAEAIDEVGVADVMRLVHDTFHHHLAGEPEFFPESTGLVHISGVNDKSVPVAGLQDAHRVLVDGRDRLDTSGQIRTLLGGGFHGPLSFEPFAESVHRSIDIAADIRASMNWLEGAIDWPDNRV